MLRLVSRGLTNLAIGENLGISVHAVKFHLASIYRKLGVSNRTEAAVAHASGFGLQRGILETKEKP